MAITKGECVDDALREIDSKELPIDKYLYLRKLRECNPRLHYAVLYNHVTSLLPYVYTPTVGEACQKYHHLSIKTWGLFISIADKGQVLQKLKRHVGASMVKVCVVTDGERILGLGDLGVGGMGISEGKILLYTVAAGVDPRYCLPICLDVGTSNEALRRDPMYPGIKQPRITGSQYTAFMEEFVQAITLLQPHILLQFEDFGNHNAFRLLQKYQPQICCFNDDIQGTACIVLAGILSALRLTGGELSSQKFLFLGAGEAGVGIAELIAASIRKQTGCRIEDARKRCLFMDSKGLVCKSRDSLQPHKQAFAHNMEYVPDLQSAVARFRPTALIGVSTQASSFTKAVIEAMAQNTTRPIIFPLSNPTDKSECTFQDALKWTSGQVLFASGSPFDSAEHLGKKFFPAQANNAYVFPAVGHAAVLCKAKTIPNDAFLVAAEVLSTLSPVHAIDQGHLFPPFSSIIGASETLMLSLCKFFEAQGLGVRPVGHSWQEVIKQSMWTPLKHWDGLLHTSRL